MEEKISTLNNLLDVEKLRDYVGKHGITEGLKTFLNNSEEGIRKICEYCPGDISIDDIRRNPFYGDVCEYNTNDWKIICTDTFCKIGQQSIFRFLFGKISQKDIMADIYRYALGIGFCINEYPKTEGKFHGATRKMRKWHIENLIKIFKDMDYDYWTEKIENNENLYRLYFQLPSGLIIYFYVTDDIVKGISLHNGYTKIEGQMASLIEKDIIDRYNNDLEKNNIWCIPHGEQKHLSKKKKFIISPFD